MDLHNCSGDRPPNSLSFSFTFYREIVIDGEGDRWYIFVIEFNSDLTGMFYQEREGGGI